MRISGNTKVKVTRCHSHLSKPGKTNKTCFNFGAEIGCLLLVLEVIEGLVEDVIIPLVGDQLVIVVNDGEGIDEGGAQEGVHVMWQELAITRPVLRPVGEVALHPAGRPFEEKRKIRKSHTLQN